MKNKEAERYLKEIRKNIGIGGRLKEEYLGGLSERVYEYCEEKECTKDALSDVFGRPDVIASQFIETIPKSEIQKKLNIRRIVLFSVIAVILIYLLFIVISFIDVHREAHGYFEEEILLISSFLTGGI